MAEKGSELSRSIEVGQVCRREDNNRLSGLEGAQFFHLLGHGKNRLSCLRVAAIHLKSAGGCLPRRPAWIPASEWSYTGGRQAAQDSRSRFPCPVPSFALPSQALHRSLGRPCRTSTV